MGGTASKTRTRGLHTLDPPGLRVSTAPIESTGSQPATTYKTLPSSGCATWWTYTPARIFKDPTPTFTSISVPPTPPTVLRLCHFGPRFLPRRFAHACRDGFQPAQAPGVGCWSRSADTRLPTCDCVHFLGTILVTIVFTSFWAEDNLRTSACQYHLFLGGHSLFQVCPHHLCAGLPCEHAHCGGRLLN